MNTPEPLMIDGQPIVVGRIVHLVEAPTGAAICRPACVLGSSDEGHLDLQVIGPSSYQAVLTGVMRGPAIVVNTWHWPNANYRQCQGRP